MNTEKKYHFVHLQQRDQSDTEKGEKLLINEWKTLFERCGGVSDMVMGINTRKKSSLKVHYSVNDPSSLHHRYSLGVCM